MSAERYLNTTSTDKLVFRPEDPEEILARYPLNASYPAQPALVMAEQRIIQDEIARRVMARVPEHYTASMRAMVGTMTESLDARFMIENQISFNAADRTKLSFEMQMKSERYARGLASGVEVLDLALATDLDTAGLVMRTHAFEPAPQDLKDDIHAVLERVVALQGYNDRIEAFDKRTKVKQLDRALGKGGLEAMELSRKMNIATVQDGEVILTQRETVIVDVSSLPMRWRSLLRKAVADFVLHGDEEDSEDAAREQIYRQLVKIPNPDNPAETLETISFSRECVDPYMTTLYLTKAAYTRRRLAAVTK